jgi:hypothetical protein
MPMTSGVDYHSIHIKPLLYLIIHYHDKGDFCLILTTTRQMESQPDSLRDSQIVGYVERQIGREWIVNSRHRA